MFICGCSPLNTFYSLNYCAHIYESSSSPRSSLPPLPRKQRRPHRRPKRTYIPAFPLPPTTLSYKPLEQQQCLPSPLDYSTPPPQNHQPTHFHRSPNDSDAGLNNLFFSIDTARTSDTSKYRTHLSPDLVTATLSSFNYSFAIHTHLPSSTHPSSDDSIWSISLSRYSFCSSNSRQSSRSPKKEKKKRKRRTSTTMQCGRHGDEWLFGGWSDMVKGFWK